VSVRVRLGATILTILLGCGGSPPPYQERTLPSGQTVKVLGVGKMFFTKGDAALMLKYQTDLNLRCIGRRSGFGTYFVKTWSGRASRAPS